MIEYRQLISKVKDKDTRNYILMFWDTMLFINAMTFISVNAVIAYFLNSLGASTLQISLANALVSIGIILSQPIFVKLAMESSYKIKIFTRILYTQRIFFLVYILTIPYFAKNNPHLAITLFLICWGIFNLFTGSYSPMYSSLLSKMIPHRKRGRLLGFAGGLGNIIALGASYLIGLLLRQIAYPYNYTLIFLIGILFLLLDVVVFQLMKENPDTVLGKYVSYFRHISGIPKYLKNNINIRRIIIGNSFIVISNVALGYYVIYAIRTYKAGAEQVALFTGLAVIANVFGSSLFGFLADRHGHKLILQLAAMFSMLAGIVILSTHVIIAVYIAFVFSTLCTSGFNLSSSVMIIHNSPKDQIPVYVSANSMITMILYSVVMIASGYVIDKFSFTPIFVIISIAGIIAFLVFKFSEIES
jgi:MFS family permease